MPKPCLKLLIVDDKEEEHDLYLSYLRHDRANDYEFFHAYDGEEALKICREQKIDCILLDNNMPRMSGLDVLQHLANEGPPMVSAIMLTGEGNETIAVTAMKYGSQDYIPKRVVTPGALQRAILHMSERAEMVRRLEASRHELERSNNDLEQFATIVAHDLKAPLRAITQHLQIVEQNTKGKLDESTQVSIRFAVDGAARMRRLIEGLFDYSKFGFGETVCVQIDTGALLTLVCQNLESDIRERKGVITHDALPDVQGDSVQVQQLLQNLIGNALKYCTATPHIHIGALREDEEWIFSVKDNGIGIAPEQHERIFRIFSRLHRDEYPGIGVGLAICDRVVKNHNGRIWVESTPGAGSTFFFTLPAAEAPLKEAADNVVHL